MLSPDAMAQTQRESFEEFRARVKGNYQQFRKTLLDNYADFLAGEWHEYQSLNGTSRDATPEPRKLPVYKPEKPQTPAQPTEPERETPGPATPRAEVPKATSKPKSDRATDRFLLGTMPVQISHADYQISHKLYSNNDYAAHWRELDRQEVASNVVPALQALAAEAGLNGYLTYKLAESYVNTRHADADATSRISLLHYLLAHLGYDSRLATTATGVPMLLLPLDRTVHARTFLKMDGRKYYIFTPEGIDQHAIAGQPISTCRIPEDLNQNKPIDMLIGQLNLPSKPKPFEIAYGGISISGNVNENLIPLLYNYPQMEVSEYGRCNPDPKLRASVTQQIHDQLATLPADQGAEKLLGFMQRAFDYATDEDFHGFEKPYFIEETLYYPKNDCEDRAIFYTYFLWNAIGKPAQIVTFPGHAAATITLDSPIDGVSYDSQGRKWWISDPTYVGAPTGLVMPMYRDTKPKVEITYQ
ncbi:MAG: hypothetical protein K2M87_04950 [Muribaculaceae bacterium]|nr:hypothetical protein [Muribaculaceae bacterium]